MQKATVGQTESRNLPCPIFKESISVSVYFMLPMIQSYGQGQARKYALVGGGYMKIQKIWRSQMNRGISLQSG